MQYELTQNDQDLIDHLMSDKDAFNDFLYTPCREAIAELKLRSGSTNLESYLNKILPTDLHEILQNKLSMVMFRNIGTPNFEFHRFMMCADAFPELQPIILEHTNDKYLDVNDVKRALADLSFYKGKNKHGQALFERKNIVNQNISNGKIISSLQTTWGESLVTFHHDLLHKKFPSSSLMTFNLSEWLYSIGPRASAYYPGVLSLFLKHGVLFDNYFTSAKEYPFTKTVVLPSFIKVLAETGQKPLIVALDPFDSEEEHFWLAYPAHLQEAVNSRNPKIASVC